MNLGLVGDSKFLKKVYAESKFVNGIHIQGICAQNPDLFLDIAGDGELLTSDYQALLERVDAVYIRSQPADHYDQIKLALEQGKNVLCEAPVTVDVRHWHSLKNLAEEKGLVLMDALKTAYATAFTGCCCC